MGKWYELIRYPVPFQKSSNYNTTVEYTLLRDGRVDVVNTTSDNSFSIAAYGIATPLGGSRFHIDFTSPVIKTDANEANYIVRHVWTDKKNAKGNYKFALVTSAKEDVLWILSREPNPSIQDYEDVLEYTTERYDSNKFILTPHYERK